MEPSVLEQAQAACARAAALRKRALRARLEALLVQDRAQCLVLHAEVQQHLTRSAPAPRR